ncbi:MAG: hypothetical protein ACI4AM_03690 [Muribaculaceae bacterium]
MAEKANIIAVVDIDKANGIRKGMYDTPTFEVLTVDEFHQLGIIAPEPRLDRTEFYIRDPYKPSSYFRINDENVDKLMVESRSIAIREALVMLGAKDIRLYKDIHDTENSETNAKVKAGVLWVNGESEFNYQKDFSLTITQNIESHDPNRVAENPDAVFTYLREHNLANDANLIGLAERLQRKGYLSGTETIEVTFLSELQSALSILCKLNVKVFNAQLDFNHQQKSTHSITYKLSVDFGMHKPQ